MILTLDGSFPRGSRYTQPTDLGFNCVLVDQPTAISPARTSGQFRSVPLDVDPTPIDQWRFVGLSLQAQLYLVNTPAPPSPGSVNWLGQSPLGELGKLLVGLCDSASSGAGVPLPSDTSLVNEVWDGDQDRLPPFVNPVPLRPAGTTDLTGPTQPLTMSAVLPQSLPLAGGNQLNIGLWLTPSVVNGVAICVYNARYAVKYER